MPLATTLEASEASGRLLLPAVLGLLLPVTVCLPVATVLLRPISVGLSVLPFLAVRR